jgi:hypothetical protein
MSLRYVSAMLAIIHGLLLGYIVFGWAMYGMMTLHDVRWLEAIAALVSGIAVLAGASTWWVFLVTAVSVIRQSILYSPWSIISSIAHGVWTFSVFDIVPFALFLLPFFGMTFALLADGRLRFLRHWPNHERA